jgi:hypothetical protein
MILGDSNRAMEAVLRLIAAAAGLRLPLVTWDVEQRDRAAGFVEVLVPENHSGKVTQG